MVVDSIRFSICKVLGVHLFHLNEFAWPFEKGVGPLMS